MFKVRVSAALADAIAHEHGTERSPQGKPSEWDFWSGPLQVALLAFRDFESLPFDDIPAIRRFQLTDPVFGATTFVAIQIGDDLVEIAACVSDPDYWRLVEADPDE